VLTIFWVLLIYSILIFPIKINVKLIISKELKKIFYSIKIFNLIKINSGYIEIKGLKIYIHVSNKKAIMIKPLSLDKNNFKIIRDYHVKELISNIELGGNTLNVNTIAFSANYIYLFIKWFISNSKPYVKYQNKNTIYNNDKINVFIKIGIYLNLIMIIVSLVKMLTEKIKHAI